LIVDGRPLVGNRTGIGTHAAEIIARLDLDPPPIIASQAVIHDRTGIENASFVVDRFPFGVAWQQMRLGAIAVREEADVLWGPHGTLPWTLRKPSVITIHDLTSITIPGHHRLKTVFSFNTFITRSLEQATRIAAVSRTTAGELARGFGIPHGRIEIVPNGVSDYFSAAELEEDRALLPSGLSSQSYILYVGTLEPRKGVDDLLQAWESLPLTEKPRLVLAGDPGWKNSATRSRAEAWVERRELMMTGFVDRPTLRALYRHAAVFIYPSHYEGFGLPPLEAMACGAPVVASRGGAIPEVVGDAALTVSPGDVSGLRAAILNILQDAGLRESLIERGRARAAQFSWTSSAALMKELILDAARLGGIRKD
ncbi:MAG: glycosyltransferase family 1 protein, partial [Acidobacteriota bacterium]